LCIIDCNNTTAVTLQIIIRLWSH